MNDDFTRSQFASDTLAATCPEAWEALSQTNELPFLPSYGEDPVTLQAEQLIQRWFDRPCAVYFLSSGTAANAFTLSLLAASHQAVLCHPYAHIECDEASAPEFFTGGAKLLHVPGENAKIDPSLIASRLTGGHGYHATEVSALSITQASELGSVYHAGELEEIRQIRAHYPHLKMHMDGARYFNAVAALGCTPSEAALGADILTLGGTKNGAGLSDAIVCFDPELIGDPRKHESIKRRLKRAGHLPSKMRYLAAPWIGLLSNETWRRNAENANVRAAQLASGLRSLGFEITVPVETNQVFVRLPKKVAEIVTARGWRFYHFATIHAHRFVCNWSTSDGAVSMLLGDFEAASKM